MKKIYMIGAALFAISTLDVSAQNALKNQGTVEPATPLTEEISSFQGKKTTINNNTHREEIFYTEDFSNGLSGINGEWTTAGSLADYWFQSFPSEDPNGYQPLEPLGDGTTVYGPYLANYFGTRQPIQSETRDNGFMMIDGDRYNSTRTEVDQPLGSNTTSNAFTAELISPVIDLTGAETLGAELEYHTYQRLCCSAYFLGLSWSFDGGETWTEPLDVFAPQLGNADLDGVKNFCLNQEVLGNENLTQFRFKFIWEGSQSHYFWMIDDILVKESPTNDIIVTNTFLTRHEEVFFDAETSYEEYFASYEYDVTPDYLLKPLEFGAAVSNPCSQNPQTNLVLTAIITPDGGGAAQTVTSTPLPLLPTGEDTLIYTEPIFLDAWNEMDPSGGYTVTFEVQQAEEDVRPDNNIGGDRVFAVSTDGGNDGFAIAQNGGLSYAGAFNQDWITQNALVNTPYVFPEPAITGSVITHVEVVFLSSEGFAETQPGEVIFFNLRKGVPFNDNEEDLPNSTVVFGSDPYLYSDAELEYVIGEDDLWVPADGFPQNWVSFELPSPVLIEAGEVYSPEIRISVGFDGGIVFFPTSSTNQERQSIWWRNFSPDPNGLANEWVTGAGTPVPSMRLRTASSLNVEKVTYEAGIKVTQNWPNPFSSETQFMYQLDKTDMVNFEVRDITGKLVHSENLGTIAAGTANTYVMNRRNLAPGIYTYSIVTSTDVVTRKMMVE